MSRPMQSISSASNNILLQVTVPKRTGRKRKRGSNDPFTDVPATETHDGPPRPTARQFMQSLRDNVGKYQVEPVGSVERTHVFRGMFSSCYSSCLVAKHTRNAGLRLLNHQKPVRQSVP